MTPAAKAKPGPAKRCVYAFMAIVSLCLFGIHLYKLFNPPRRPQYDAETMHYLQERSKPDWVRQMEAVRREHEQLIDALRKGN